MKRFAPEITYTEDRCWGEWVTSPVVKMSESQLGEWTPWQNAQDTAQMHLARIARLEARLANIEDELFLLKANL